jgi:hypothetical protein
MGEEEVRSPAEEQILKLRELGSLRIELSEVDDLLDVNVNATCASRNASSVVNLSKCPRMMCPLKARRGDGSGPVEIRSVITKASAGCSV